MRPTLQISYSIRLIAFLLLFMCSGFAYAQAGAGEQCDRVEFIPLHVAAIAGSPNELEAEIDRGVDFAIDFAKKNRELLTHPIWAMFSIWGAPETISQSMQNKRAIFINSWFRCQRVRLLELAAASGNQDVAQYLLNAGAHPNIVDYSERTIFMRCANLGRDQKWRLQVSSVPSPGRTRAEIDGKLAVYSQLIARGGDLNKVDKDGLTALHLCRDPEAVALFLRSGANPNLLVERSAEKRRGVSGYISTPVLDFRLRRMAEDYFWERDANFSILQQLLPVVENKKLDQETLWRICYECSNPRKGETCTRLSEMIEVPDQDIFSSLAQGATREVIFEKCGKYSKW